MAAEGADQPQLPRARDAPRQDGRKVAATFVPGNLNELLMCFDFARSLPETNALQNGMRKKSRQDHHGRRARRPVRGRLHVREGRPRHDAWAARSARRAKRCPSPTSCCSSYTGCFTFMKWFELIRHKYGCETVMLHVPYQGEGHIAPNMRDYVVEAAEGYGDPDARADVRRQVRHRPAAPVHEASRRRPRRISSPCCSRRRTVPRPSTATSAPSTTSARSSPRSAARREATEYYRVLRSEIEQRVRERQGSGHARRRDGRGEVSPRRRGPAELDQLPRLLEDVLRRRRRRRLVDVREGRRASTTSASATTRTIRSNRSPNTASAATRT